MKKLFFLLPALTLLLFACTRVNNDITVSNMKDLVAPYQFGWNLTRVVEVHLSNVPQGVIRLSSGDGSELYTKALADGNTKIYDFSLVMPTLVSQIKINDTVVNISQDKVDFTFPNSKKDVLVTNCAMSFNGTTSWIKVPNSTNLAFTNKYSVSAWVKATAQQTAKIIQKGDWDGLGIGQDYWNGWQTSVAFSDGTSAVVDWGNGRPQLNKWYHLAGTYDGTTVNLYVDGILKKSENVAKSIRANGRFISIGSDAGAQKFFQGVLDEVSIWTEALTTDEIYKARTIGFAGNETGLKGYWKFNDEAGSSSLDATSNHYDGTDILTARSTDVNYALTVDTDLDGVPDTYDDYPLDNTRAYDNKIPTSAFNTLVFEDLWPSQGDYDFNDLVVGYRLNAVTNANNKIVDATAVFVVRAIGGSFANGFGFQLPGCTIPISAIQCSGYSVKENYITLLPNGLEAQQPKPTVIVFDNAMKVLPNTGGSMGVNVEQGVPFVTPDTVTIHLSFPQNTYSLNQLDLSSFNPFLIVNQIRGREVHLADMPPTALMNTALLGTDNDDSKPGLGRYYKSKNNLPWALNIPGNFDYDYEKQDILNAYLKLAQWAQSGGTQNSDWYLNLPGYRNTQYIYSH